VWRAHRESAALCGAFRFGSVLFSLNLCSVELFCALETMLMRLLYAIVIGNGFRAGDATHDSVFSCCPVFTDLKLRLEGISHEH
jgi:hypothetical protein